MMRDDSWQTYFIAWQGVNTQMDTYFKRLQDVEKHDKYSRSVGDDDDDIWAK